MGLLVNLNGEQHGPYEMPQIEEMLAAGQITPDIMAWQDGMAEWAPLNTIVNIAAPAPASMPLPPAPASTPTPVSQEAVTKTENAVDNTIKKFIADEQDPVAVKKIVSKVSDVLTSDEEIQYVGVQKKPVLTIAPDAVVLTNKRFIIARPKLLGFSFTDFMWREVDDVHLSEQMLGATITCSTTDGRKVKLDSIPKKQARKIYAFAQDIEERMIEERRNREMEEMRAGAGGVVIQAPTAAPAAAGPQANDPMEQLGKLKSMLDAGLIEQSEYDAKKAEILAQM